MYGWDDRFTRHKAISVDAVSDGIGLYARANHQAGGTLPSPKNSRVSSRFKTKTGRESKWSGPGLNRRHMDFQSIALPTELPVPVAQAPAKRRILRSGREDVNDRLRISVKTFSARRLVSAQWRSKGRHKRSERRNQTPTRCLTWPKSRSYHEGSHGSPQRRSGDGLGWSPEAGQAGAADGSL